MNRQQVRAAVPVLSFLLMSVTFAYISPHGMMVGLLNGVIAAGLIFRVMVFVLTSLFGRAFCRDLCPMSLPVQKMVENNTLQYSGCIL